MDCDSTGRPQRDDQITLHRPLCFDCIRRPTGPCGQVQQILWRDAHAAGDVTAEGGVERGTKRGGGGTGGGATPHLLPDLDRRRVRVWRRDRAMPAVVGGYAPPTAAAHALAAPRQGTGRRRDHRHRSMRSWWWGGGWRRRRCAYAENSSCPSSLLSPSFPNRDKLLCTMARRQSTRCF